MNALSERFTDVGAFVVANTVVDSPALCPEIRLRLLKDDAPLKDDCPLFQGKPHLFSWDGPRPYWAFAWAGGQALARFILDRPELVRGKRVVDVGSGSGICAIAAALSGAAAVIALDSDAVAVKAIEMNARLNDVVVTAHHADMATCISEEWEVLLAGDAFYNCCNYQWVLGLAERGRVILFGDPSCRGFPKEHCEQLASCRVKTYPDLETWTADAEVLRLKRGRG
jgi:predicted nicotinamide N-methyase